MTRKRAGIARRKRGASSACTGTSSGTSARYGPTDSTSTRCGSKRARSRWRSSVTTTRSAPPPRKLGSAKRTRRRTVGLTIASTFTSVTTATVLLAYRCWIEDASAARRTGVDNTAGEGGQYRGQFTAAFTHVHTLRARRRGTAFLRDDRADHGADGLARCDGAVRERRG